MNGISNVAKYIILGKILEKAIRKLRSLIKFRKSQAAFKEERGCIDHITTLKNIIKQCTEWQRSLYVNFADFSKAFSGVHWHSLWRTLRAYEIPFHLVESIRSFFSKVACCVVDGDIPFEVRLVLGWAALCPQWFSVLLSTGSCHAPQRIRTGASDGPLLPGRTGLR